MGKAGRAAAASSDSIKKRVADATRLFLIEFRLFPQKLLLRL